MVFIFKFKIAEMDRAVQSLSKNVLFEFVYSFSTAHFVAVWYKEVC